MSIDYGAPSGEIINFELHFEIRHHIPQIFRPIFMKKRTFLKLYFYKIVLFFKGKCPKTFTKDQCDTADQCSPGMPEFCDGKCCPGRCDGDGVHLCISKGTL